ncbi:hypothetical protein J6590_034381 [Homalodisca vitripennis]|nr:hypothetical protein J6590_034381 [Homalodisca vitripennis]
MDSGRSIEFLWERVSPEFVQQYLDKLDAIEEKKLVRGKKSKLMPIHRRCSFVLVTVRAAPPASSEPAVGQPVTMEKLTTYDTYLVAITVAGIGWGGTGTDGSGVKACSWTGRQKTDRQGPRDESTNEKRPSHRAMEANYPISAHWLYMGMP